MNDSPNDRVLLIPQPKAIDRGQGQVTLPPAWLEREISYAPMESNRHGPEEYRLHVSGTSAVQIRSVSPAGARAALTTFRQLREQFGARLPVVDIHDWPSFQDRGVMLDVSRDRVPRMDELFSIVERLAGLKVNHLQLYTEHTFAYAGHEDVWRGSSPMTASEIRRLDEHCFQLGITLAANQNCFGHLASWLRHPRYAELSEIQGVDTAWTFYEFVRRGPFSLCPSDSRSFALVDDLLGQLLPCFSSGLVNINCDETFDVGQGRSKARVARDGEPAVYFEFLSSVAEACVRRGFNPMFWADIALNHPEAVHQIPASLLALAWGYEPDAPFGRWCELLRNAGRSAWVCPGTSSWRSITGRRSERRANLSAAIREGRAGGAVGVLACDWGDVGHRQQWPISLHGIAHAASSAWTGDADSFDMEAESLHVFGDRKLKIGAWIDLLGDCDLSLRKVAGRIDANGRATALRNATALFNFGLTNEPCVASAAEWDAAREAVRSAGDMMPSGLNPTIADELGHTLRVAGFAGERGLARAGGPPLRAGRERLKEILADHRRLWLARSRVGGLDHSCGYYEQLEIQP